ncbi:MAG: T9SS type A sorting domain-containing protein [Saprospiraceae bacterium]|nr:T9SS type A sorting domain-containing protein [Saprospiraceae bacterium]
MKKFIIVLVTLLFTISFNLKADHYMGGEITWSCTTSGNFKFTIKLYRECYTATGTAANNFPDTLYLKTTVPGFDSIMMTRLSGYPVDVSPVCNSNPAFSHIYCDNSSPMTGATANLGAIQEHIYTSDYSYPSGVPLTGIPPTNGWMFYYGGCCRNSSSNIVNSNSLSFRIRSIMYPFNNQNVSTCFDHSPTFAELPQIVICSGYPFKYDHIAYDVELDSLTFSWGQPLLSSGTSIANYAAGYSWNNPLPGTLQNPNNVAATIDPVTGEISFTSYTSGAFVVSTKITSYKCGSIKVSEIWRDMQITINNCGTNNPPNIVPPIMDSTTGLFTLYRDSVYAGELICFSIIGNDFEFLPNGTPQTMTLEAYGFQFGNILNTTPPSMSTTSGCLNPPCATLSPTPVPGIQPLTGQFGLQTQFCWQTDCNHLATNMGCGRTLNAYDFKFKVFDDYCPAPAIAFTKVTIVVNNLPELPPPNFVSIVTDSLTGDNTLYWIPLIDTASIFNKYLIYHSSNKNGPFSIIDSLDVLDTNSYVHIGANGTTNLSYYYLKTKSLPCYYYKTSIPSDTLVSSFGDLGANYLINQSIKLSQNIPNPTNKTTSINYYLPKSGNTVFKVVNIVGEIVYENENNSQQGENKIELDISNFESGVYYYSLEFEGVLKVKKMVVLK